MELYKKQISPNLGWLLLLFIYSFAYFSWRTQTGDVQLNAASLFPLFGLLAWLTMWSHYAMTGRDIYFSSDLSSKSYWLITRFLVMSFLLLHPLLLAWNQWQVLEQLPPGSFYTYVATGLKFYVFLGSLALLIFLSFELFKYFKKSKWVTNHSKWIELSQITAMVLVYIHAIKLGAASSSDVVLFVWIILGASLLPIFWLVINKVFKNNS